MNHADPKHTVPTPLTARDSLIREQSLVKALARAIAIIELIDLDAAVNIVGELEGDVAKLVGGPIILNCADAVVVLVEPLPDPEGCIFSEACIHRSTPTMHSPIFGSFGDYPAPPDGWARCSVCLGLITAEQIEDICPGPPRWPPPDASNSASTR